MRQSDFREEIGGPQRWQYTRIDLVRLDVRMCNCLDLQRIGHDHAGHIRKLMHDDHCVAGRLNDDLVLFAQATAEAFQPRAGHSHSSRRTQPAILPEHHLGKRSVNVHADHTSHPLLLSFALAGAVGNTTTTDPRSQRNRVGRRCGQLLTRALGSSYTSPSHSACSRCPSSRMVAPYAGTKLIPAERVSTAIFIPVTNSLERLQKEVNRRTDVVGIFPNEAAIIRLIGTVLLQRNDEWQLQRPAFGKRAVVKLL